MDGTISVRSEKGRGSSFTIVLPLGAVAAPPPSAVAEGTFSGVLVVDNREDETATRILKRRWASKRFSPPTARGHSASGGLGGGRRAPWHSVAGCRPARRGRGQAASSQPAEAFMRPAGADRRPASRSGSNGRRQARFYPVNHFSARFLLDGLRELHANKERPQGRLFDFRGKPSSG